MRSWCFDSQESGGVYDREYGSADIREVVGKLIGNGVYATPTTNMQVVADTGMTVSVQPGSCWINGAYGCIDDAEDLTIDASSSGRVDLIVARFDLSLSYRSIRVTIIKGTDGSTTPPPLTQSDSVRDIQLAKINVRASAMSILQSDITDTRHDSSICGIVTGVVNQIDATNLFAQFTTAFNAWFDEMKDQLSTDAAGNLQLQINEINAPPETVSLELNSNKVTGSVSAYIIRNVLFVSVTFQVLTSKSPTQPGGGIFELINSNAITPLHQVDVVGVNSGQKDVFRVKIYQSIYHFAVNFYPLSETYPDDVLYFSAAIPLSAV